jgi:hypothetical protein
VYYGGWGLKLVALVTVDPKQVSLLFVVYNKETFVANFISLELVKPL